MSTVAFHFKMVLTFLNFNISALEHKFVVFSGTSPKDINSTCKILLWKSMTSTQRKRWILKSIGFIVPFIQLNLFIEFDIQFQFRFHHQLIWILKYLIYIFLIICCCYRETSIQILCCHAICMLSLSLFDIFPFSNNIKTMTFVVEWNMKWYLVLRAGFSADLGYLLPLPIHRSIRIWNIVVGWTTNIWSVIQ